MVGSDSYAMRRVSSRKALSRFQKGVTHPVAGRFRLGNAHCYFSLYDRCVLDKQTRAALDYLSVISKCVCKVEAALELSWTGRQ